MTVKKSGTHMEISAEKSAEKSDLKVDYDVSACKQAFRVRLLQSAYDAIQFLQFSLYGGHKGCNGFIDESTLHFVRDFSYTLMQLDAETLKLIQNSGELRAPFEDLMRSVVFQQKFPGLYFTLNHLFDIPSSRVIAGHNVFNDFMIERKDTFEQFPLLMQFQREKHLNHNNPPADDKGKSEKENWKEVRNSATLSL